MSASLAVARTQPKKKNQEVSAHYVQINLRVLSHALGYDANTTRSKKVISGSGNDQSRFETKSASDSKNIESGL